MRLHNGDCLKIPFLKRPVSRNYPCSPQTTAAELSGCSPANPLKSRLKSNPFNLTGEKVCALPS
jgi:hypothetical protein